jgi:hypothetical protein
LSVPIYDFAQANQKLVKRLWNNIMFVAERAFVQVAYTPAMSLETLGHVRFVKQVMWAKLMEKELKK